MTRAFATLLLAMAPPLHAQQPPPPPPAREVKAEFAFVATSGNAATQSIGAAGDVTFRPPDWVVNGKAAFIRNESNDIVSAKSFATLGRVARILTPRLQGFGQHAFLRDLFSGIRSRNTVDGGLSYLLVQTERHALFVDGGLGFLNEQRTLGSDLSTGLGTAGTRYKLTISETSDFTDDLLIAADFAEDGTWRASHAAAVTARVATILSLKLSNVIRFVNVPVPGFKQTDTVTSAALVLSF